MLCNRFTSILLSFLILFSSCVTTRVGKNIQQCKTTNDLRRTFGLNLIKQGMSIYKVSKLLGHKSVRTTEQHYAPLLTVEIEDFVL